MKSNEVLKDKRNVVYLTLREFFVHFFTLLNFIPEKLLVRTGSKNDESWQIGVDNKIIFKAILDSIQNNT